MPVKISAKSGIRNSSSKKSNLLHPKANDPKNIFKKSSIFNTDTISYYSNPPNSEIDEVICQGKDEFGNDIYFIKLKNQSYKNKRCIKRKEFKNYFNGEQVFNYFSKLPFRKSFNQLFLVEEKILHSISSNGKNSYLIKWAYLPISYSTWEESVTSRLIENYNDRHKIDIPKKISINMHSIQIPNMYELNPVQIDVVKNIIYRFTKKDDENDSHFSLLGGIGSIMRKEVYASFNYIRKKLSCKYPILFIVDEDLVSIVKIEIENFLGEFCLAINYDVNEISEIKEYGWFYHGTDIPIYHSIVISYDSLPLLIDFIQKTNFLLICADATSNKSSTNTISNLLTDFIDDGEIPKPTTEKSQLTLIEDYLKISDLNSFMVISLLPFFFHSPTKTYFLDSFCEPSRLCQEEFVVCKLTPEQRTEYDTLISNHIEKLNQSLVDCLNLIIDHPLFNFPGFSIDSVTENEAWSFIQKSGKMMILHEFVKKAIYEEKRTMIITTNKLFFVLLKKYFQLMNKKFEIFDKNSFVSESSSATNSIKHQFVLSLVDSSDCFPWSSLELDWIFCLTPFINPVYRNSNWDFVLTENFVVKKCTIFRFFVEDTFESYLTIGSTANLNDNPNLLHFLRASFDYPIRLLSNRSKIFPFFLRSIQFQPQDYIGDFEPCMLEKANSFMIPTTSLQIDKNEDEDEEGKKIVSHFLQYSEENQKLVDALNFDIKKFDQNWSIETVSAAFKAISNVCWGNWDLMVLKMPIEICPGLMKEVAYLFLDHLLKNSDREYKIAQTFLSKHVSQLDQSLNQEFFSLISEFINNLHQNELNCRLDRIEDMMILTMVLARCNVKNIPSQIILPKNVQDGIPSAEWKKDNDRRLLFNVYLNGYNSFGSEFADLKFAHLSCRFHSLIQAFIPEIPQITGYKSVVRSKPQQKGKVRSSKSLVKISKKSPSSSSQISQPQKNDERNTNHKIERSISDKSNRITNDKSSKFVDDKIERSMSDKSNKYANVKSSKFTDDKIERNESDTYKSSKFTDDRIERNESDKVNKFADDKIERSISDKSNRYASEKTEKYKPNKFSNDKIEKYKSNKTNGIASFRKTLNIVWTKEEQKDFTNLLIDFGPKLSITDFRSLIPLDGKTDRDILTLKTKIADYEKTGKQDEYLISPPARETIQSSYNFFREIDELNFDEFYCEDQSTLKAMKFWGLRRSMYSPLLQSVFGTNMIGPSMLQSELDKIKSRKIGKENKTKLKFRIKLKYNKGENGFTKSYEKTDSDSKSELPSSPSQSNLNGEIKIDCPYDTIQGRNVVYPVQICNDIKIVSIGHINSAPEFSNNEFIYPEGYSASCSYNGMDLSCLIRSKNSAPMFRVVNPRKRTKMASVGKTPEEAWYNFLKDILKISPFSFDLWRVPGHELFGLCSPLTKRLIQALPGAQNCTSYKPVAFRTPIKDIEFSVLSPENRFSLDNENGEEEEKAKIEAVESEVPTFNDNLSDEVENDVKIDHKIDAVENDVKIDHKIDAVENDVKIDHKIDVAENDVKIDHKIDVAENDVKIDHKIDAVEKLPKKVPKIKVNKFADFNEDEANEEDDGNDDDDTEYKGYTYKYKAKKAFKMKQKEKLRQKTKIFDADEKIENLPPKKGQPHKAIAYTNYNINDEDDSYDSDDDSDGDYKRYKYKAKNKKSKHKEKVKSKVKIQADSEQYVDESHFKEPIKIKDKGRQQSRHRRIDSLLNENGGDENENGDGQINENWPSVSNIEANSESQNNKPPKPFKVVRDGKPPQTEKSKEKVRIKLSDFYSSENEESNIAHDITSPIRSPPPSLTRFDGNDSSIDKYDETLKRDFDERRKNGDDDFVDDLNIENEKPPLTATIETPLPDEEEELKPMEKPDLPIKKKVYSQPKKNESIYSFYRESEDDEEGDTANKDEDGEFVSHDFHKPYKSQPNTASQSTSPSTLSSSSSGPRRRGRKPKNRQIEESPQSPPFSLQKPKQSPPKRIYADEEYENGNDDFDDDSSSEKKDKSDKSFICPFKNFAHTNVMRTRSCETRQAFTSVKKRKRIRDDSETSSDEDYNGYERREKTRTRVTDSRRKEINNYSNTNNNNNNDDDNEVGRQLVMRPNFNSRRKRPKEPVIDGIWIQTDKKNDEAEKTAATEASQSPPERFSSPSPPPHPNQSKSASNSSSSMSHRNAELHFDFSLLASRMEKAGCGFGKTEIAFSSKDLFKHINPAAHPDSFKHELKKFGDNILESSSMVRDALGFNEQSSSGVWKNSDKE